MLEARGLGYAQGGRVLFQHLDLTIGAGEIVGLGGASGSGKTTLARLLAGLLQPDRGKVTLNGRPLPDTGRRPVQWVPQSPETSIDPRWRLGQILANGGAVQAEILSRLQIDHLPQWRRKLELSGGELARASLARFLMPCPEVLICDEITAQLDAMTSESILVALREIAARSDSAILLISHDSALRRRFCTRDLLLSDGQLLPA